MTRSSLSKSSPCGRNSGKTFTATNRMVMSGTPRRLSMNTTLTALTAGMLERRPSASTMASGKPITSVPENRIRVSGRPPHWLLSTSGRPRTPPHIRVRVEARVNSQTGTRMRYCQKAGIIVMMTAEI